MFYLQSGALMAGLGNMVSILFDFVLAIAVIMIPIGILKWIYDNILPPSQHKRSNRRRSVKTETWNIEIPEHTAKITWKKKTPEPSKDLLNMSDEDGLAFWRSESDEEVYD